MTSGQIISQIRLIRKLVVGVPLDEETEPAALLIGPEAPNINVK